MNDSGKILLRLIDVAIRNITILLNIILKFDKTLFKKQTFEMDWFIGLWEKLYLKAVSFPVLNTESLQFLFIVWSNTTIQKINRRKLNKF